MKTMSKQRGMAALTMIMVIVILLAVIGTIVAASRTSANSTGDQQLKLQASAIIDQGNTLRNGLVLMVNKGTVGLDTVTMDNNSTTGLYGSSGGTIKQTPPAEAINSPSTTVGVWTYFRGSDATPVGVTITSVTGTANTTYAFVLNGIKKDVCNMINKLHYGASTAGVTDLQTTATWDSSGVGSIATTALNIGGTAGSAPAGWNFGCLMNKGSTTDGLYFNVVQP